MKRTVLDQVWNPTQHIALWLAAWLTGHEGYDYTVEALAHLGGPEAAGGSVELVDAWVPDVIDTAAPVGRAEFMRLVRACVAEAERSAESRPLIRLLLSGPGEVPALPAGTEAAIAAAAAGSAIAIADTDPDWTHIVVPPAGPERAWRWYSVGEPLPEPAHLGPGEADFQLAEAARLAAATIQSRRSGAAFAGADGTSGSGRPDPRLLVGLLDDHLDLAYLPESLPRRAATVIARADRVASILTVAQGAESGVATSEFDPELIPLWRTIRHSRMSAVEYAVRQWSLGDVY